MTGGDGAADVRDFKGLARNMGKLNSERTYQRIAFVYLCFIIAATALFFFLGLLSYQLRRDELQDLGEEKLNLWGQRLAAEFERHIWALAEECLRDPGLETLRAIEDGLSPPEARSLRATLSRIGERHPIAQAFVVIEDGNIRFPLIEEPDSRTPRMATNGDDLRAHAVLIDARRLLGSGRPERARPLFEYVRTLASSDWLKATADAEVAKLLSTGDPAERAAAREVFERLVGDYGNLVDENYRPLAVTGAVGLATILGADGLTPPEALAVLQDLRKGRWELSSSQLNAYTAELAAVLPSSMVEPVLSEGTPYVTQISVAPRVSEEVGSTTTRRIRQFALPASGAIGPVQVFYESLTPSLLVAFVADLQWAESVQLAACQAEYADGPQLDVGLRESASAESSDILGLPFRSLLDSWELHISRQAFASQQVEMRQSASGLVLSSLMFLSVLGLALYLLLRLTREVQLSQVQTTFFSAFSHELKTPLTLIRLYTEILQADDGSPRERQDYYRIIARASSNLTKLIEGFQKFVLVRRNRMRFNLEVGDLGAAIGETVVGYAEYLKRQDFEFEMELPKEPIFVLLDSEAVSQALLNLLENARKYSEKSKFIAVRLWSDRESGILEVEDHGTGIPRTEQERIFEEFYRVEVPDRERSGFGLGLFLVRHIMLAHRGRVELDSEPGRGSRFRLIFPLANPESSVTAKKKPLVLERGVTS